VNLEDVVVCRDCGAFAVYRGTLFCAACVERMSTGWPDDPTEPLKPLPASGQLPDVGPARG